jgi:predicted lactoylglutathione lyase
VRAAFVDHLALQVRDLEASKRFYAAYVTDPDGHNIEAVYHGDR